MIDSIQFFYYISFVNYKFPWMIYSSLEHYALITLQKEPGYIRRWMGPESLKKFELDQ